MKLFLGLLFFLFSFHISLFGQVNVQDSLALVALYESTDGDSWINNDNWLTGDIDTWYGVNVFGNRVSSIQLVDNGLEGEIPQEIGDLDQLISLNLSQNHLTGGIPTTIGQLSQLGHLDLFRNELNGTIPAIFGDLSNLSYLSLTENLIDGSIPVELSQLEQLSQLRLADNLLDGALPKEIGLLSNLMVLNLHNNLLGGSIPKELGQLQNLESLLLMGNQLVGPIPKEIGDLSNVKDLWFQDNNLTGEIPAEIGDLLELKSLLLANNELSGEIPSQLSEAKDLETIWLGHNKLVGAIPSELGELSKLKSLLIESNLLTGDIPQELENLEELVGLDLSLNLISGEIPTALALLQNLESLRLNDNQLEGLIPVELSTMAKLTQFSIARNPWLCEPEDLGYAQWTSSLALYDNQSICIPLNTLQSDSLSLVTFYRSTNGEQWINNNNWLTGDIDTWHGITIGEGSRVAELKLSNNRLEGLMPAHLGNLNALEELVLYDNELSGELDSWIGNLEALKFIDLSDNHLTGSIPQEIGNLSELETIQIFNNHLTGQIPDEIGLLSQLWNLMLGKNFLTGGIPSSITELTNLRWLQLQDNKISGSIPDDLGQLGQLELINLDKNQLIGEIPSSINSLGLLEKLYLSNNQLSGSLPNDIGQLSNLTDLDIKNNKVGGHLPSSIGELALLEYMSLSNTELTGSIPLSITNLMYLGRPADGWIGSFNYAYTNLCEPQDAVYQEWKKDRSITVNGSICEEAIFNSFGIDGDSNLPSINYVARSIYLNIDVDDLTNLVAYFDVSPNTEVHIDGVEQISKATSNDFSQEVIYTLTNTVAGVSLDWKVLLTNEPIINGVIASDYNALVDLYNMTEGNNWVKNDNWLSDLAVDQWIGIETIGNRVRSIALGGDCCIGNNLRGNLPMSIGQLTALRALSLFGNNGLSGSIPSSIGQLADLTYLRLASNRLTGSLPSEMGSLEHIRFLAITYNNISGPIPVEIGQLDSLKDLNLSGNELTGEIPVELYELGSLESLDLSQNELGGSITSAIAELENIEDLRIWGNNLTGPLPAELFELEHIYQINLSGNDIDDLIPESIGEASNLNRLNLSGNELSGSIPTSIGKLHQLKDLILNDNPLTGPLPSSITFLSRLGAEGIDALWIHQTDICEPATQTYQNWKDGRAIISSGLMCEIDPLDFQSYSIAEQINDAWVNTEMDTVGISVACASDFIYKPTFILSEGTSAYVNGELQVSGSSEHNFSEPVLYTLTDQEGNEALWQVNVTDINQLVDINVEINANVSCIQPNGSAILTTIATKNGLLYAPFDGYKVEWSNDDFNSIFNTSHELVDLSNGEYQLKVTELRSGCSVVKSITVIDSTQIYEFDTEVIHQTSCDAPNGQLEIQSISIYDREILLPDPRFTFSWRHGPTGEVLTDLAAGTYTVDIEDIFIGCTYEQSFTVEGQTLSGTIQATSNNVTSCESNNGSVSASVDGTTDDYDFEWYAGGSTGGTPISTSTTVSSLGAGSYTVKVSETGSDCFSTKTVSIGNETQTIDVNLTAVNNTSCASANGIVAIESLEIDGEERTSTSGYSIEWSIDRSFDEVLSTRDEVDDLAAATYFVRVSQSGTGCTSPIHSISVEDELTTPQITVSTEDNTTCTATANGAATITNETTGLTIAWYEGDEETLLPNQSSSQLTGLLSGNYSAVVTNSTTGCTAKRTFTIGEALPQITLTTTATANTNCVNENGMAAVTAIAVNGQIAMDYSAFSIAWSTTEDFATIAFTEDTLEMLTAGDYYVRATLDSVSCLSSIIKTTVTNQLAEVGITLVNTTIDKPGEEATGSLEITTVEGATINWYAGEEATGTVMGTTSILSSIDAGPYTVAVTDPTTGCTSSQTYEVSSDSRTTQVITFGLPESLYQDELPLLLTASSDQNVDINYSITQGTGVINGNLFTSAEPGELIITAFNEGTDAVASAEATATIIVKGNYDLSGAVIGANNNDVIDGEIIVFDVSGEVVTSASFSQSSYQIPQLREGEYYLKVEPSANDGAVLSTYHEQALTLSAATAIELSANTVIDVTMLATAPTSGNGAITGAVVAGDGGSRIVIGRTLDGTPLAEVNVYLVDRVSGAVVAQDNTDASGKFMFENVATGQYRFVIDAVGFETSNLEADIDYDESQGTLEVSAEIGTQGLEVEYALVSGAEEELLKDISIFPNPAQNILHVEDVQSRIKSIQLLNLTGQLTRTFEANSTGQYDISTLTNGMYMMRIELEDKQFVHTKVVIRH